MVGQIDVVMRELETFTSKRVRGLTLNITANIVEDNPVHTGWSRANWVARIATPLVVDLRDVTPNVAGATARQQQSLAQIAGSYEIGMGKIFISNNVPYIVRLNEGSSSQAPAGFIQAGVRRGVEAAR